jgi:hypothetical protein
MARYTGPRLKLFGGKLRGFTRKTIPSCFLEVKAHSR